MAGVTNIYTGRQLVVRSTLLHSVYIVIGNRKHLGIRFNLLHRGFCIIYMVTGERVVSHELIETAIEVSATRRGAVHHIQFIGTVGETRKCVVVAMRAILQFIAPQQRAVALGIGTHNKAATRRRQFERQMKVATIGFFIGPQHNVPAGSDACDIGATCGKAIEARIILAVAYVEPGNVEHTVGRIIQLHPIASVVVVVLHKLLIGTKLVYAHSRNKMPVQRIELLETGNERVLTTNGQ